MIKWMLSEQFGAWSQDYRIKKQKPFVRQALMLIFPHFYVLVFVAGYLFVVIQFLASSHCLLLVCCFLLKLPLEDRPGKGKKLNSPVSFFIKNLDLRFDRERVWQMKNKAYVCLFKIFSKLSFQFALMNNWQIVFCKPANHSLLKSPLIALTIQIRWGF